MKPTGKFKAVEADLDESERLILEQLGEKFVPLMKALRSDSSSPNRDNEWREEFARRREISELKRAISAERSKGLAARALEFKKKRAAVR